MSNNDGSSNVSRLKVTGFRLEENGEFYCEVEGRTNYKKIGIHWLRQTIDKSWLKIRTDCVPASIINRYNKLKQATV